MPESEVAVQADKELDRNVFIRRAGAGIAKTPS